MAAFLPRRSILATLPEGFVPLPLLNGGVMANSRRRLWACALILVCSIAVTEAQQQRSRGPDRSRVDRVAAAGGVIGSVDADGVPEFVWAARARPGPAGAAPDVAARWHLRQFAQALDVSAADVDATVTRGVHVLS